MAANTLQCSMDKASAHFERALACKEAQPEDPSGMADLLFGLGRAQAATQDSVKTGGAVANLVRAFGHYVESGDVAQAMAVATHPVGALSAQTGGMADLHRRALRLVTLDSHEAGRILAYRGSVIGMDEGDYTGAQLAFSRALDNPDVKKTLLSRNGRSPGVRY